MRFDSDDDDDVLLVFMGKRSRIAGLDISLEGKKLRLMIDFGDDLVDEVVFNSEYKVIIVLCCKVCCKLCKLCCKVIVKG